ncbi:MAG TPA: MFS transporter [Candidatus Obscuribacterales bacterium]
MPNNTASFRVIVLLGVVSLFADVVYEGARSIIGPYLATFGATGAAIGFIAGFSELLAYAIRMGSGRFARDQRFIWPTIGIGYLLTLVAAPALALVNSWTAAAVLIFTERFGKGVRAPARDVVLAEAAGDNKGFAFGLHHTLDQTGAVIGPLAVAAILFYSHSYQLALGWLAIPGALAMLCLGTAWLTMKQAQPAKPDSSASPKLPRSFWFYSIALGFVAAGFVDFPLIAYGLTSHVHLSASLVPIAYAVAMAAEAAAAIPLGKLFDKFGFNVVRILAWLCAPIALLVFSHNLIVVFLGSLLWGAGMVFQQSLAKAIVAQLIPSENRSIAYGAYGLVYGICWFAGSFVIGWAFDHNVHTAIAISIALEVVGAILLLLFKMPVNKVAAPSAH